MGQALGRTSFPGVFKRGDRFAVRWRDETGGMRQRSARTFEEGCNRKRAIRNGERPSERDLPLVAFDRRPRGWARRRERLLWAAEVMADPERRRRASTA